MDEHEDTRRGKAASIQARQILKAFAWPALQDMRCVADTSVTQTGNEKATFARGDGMSALCELHGLVEEHDLAGYGEVCSDCYALLLAEEDAKMQPHYSIEKLNANTFTVYGHYERNGKPASFVAMQTWSKERAEQWVAEHDIKDGMIVAKVAS